MDVWRQLDNLLRQELPELPIRYEEPMHRYTSFRIGGPARRMAVPETGEQLLRLLDIAEHCGIEPLILGKGSNLLVPDAGIERLVICMTGGLHRITAGGAPNTIHAEAGASLAGLAEFACRQGLAGLEFAHGIPGTVGGAVCMNAGAYQGEIAQVLQSAQIWRRGEGLCSISVEKMEFSYRHSLLSDAPDAVVVSAVFALEKGEPELIREKMRDLMERRKASQPLDLPSAGSTFKRPSGGYAAALIDQCGLKGLTVGGAQVSPKHAGFVVNLGNATFSDVTHLIAMIQEQVLEKTGIRLDPEVKIVS